MATPTAYRVSRIAESPGAAGPLLGGDPVTETLDLFRWILEPEERAWQERALCAETDPEAFFPDKGGSVKEAKQVCSGCPVRGECLAYALEHDERFGIWGGLSERQRRVLKRAEPAPPACPGSYENRGIARAAIKGMDAHRRPDGIYEYHCRTCGRWHLRTPARRPAAA